MAQIAGLSDFRAQGPPADIGTFQLTCSVLVFQFTFSGTTYNVAMRTGVRGWILVSVDAAIHVVMNASITYLGGIGGDIFVLRGAYVAAVQIAVNQQRINIMGEGDATAFSTTANIPIFLVTQPYVTIKKVALSGNNVGAAQRGIYINGVDQVEVNTCSISTFGANGVFCWSSDWSEFIDLRITNNSGHQLQIAGGSNCLVAYCKVSWSASYGIQLHADGEDCNRHVVIGNILTGSGAGTGTGITVTFWDFGHHRHIIANNQVYNVSKTAPSADCILLAGDATHINEGCVVIGNIGQTANIGISLELYIQQAVIADNVLHDFRQYGIMLAFTVGCITCHNVCRYADDVSDSNGIVLLTAIDCIVDDNQCQYNGLIQNGSSEGVGIRVAGASSDCIISKNNCSNNNFAGIKLNDTAAWISILGNICRNNNGGGAGPGWNTGISLDGVITDCLIDGNIIRQQVYGIWIVNAASLRNTVGHSNKISATNIMRDDGTDTILPELFLKVTDPNGNIGRNPCIVLTDGVDVTVRDQIPADMSFQEIVRVQVVVIPGGTGNLRRGVNTDWSKIGAAEAYNTHTDSIAAGEVAVTVNRREALDATAAISPNLAAGDLVGFEFTRYGSHANDTVNADCYYLGVRIQYV